jgi:hypothetical protein
VEIPGDQVSAKIGVREIRVRGTELLLNGKPVHLTLRCIEATTGGADVSVDGAFVGSSPAVLKLTAGKHTLGVVQTGFSAWTKDLSVMAGSSAKLNATLIKQ